MPAVLERPETEPVDDFLSFEAEDVTGTFEIDARDVERSTPAGAVAKALASRMALPESIPWALHDASGRFLVDDEPIGDQIKTGTRVTVTPKTHLGGM